MHKNKHRTYTPFKENGMWWFVLDRNDTQDDYIGPFNSKEECMLAVEQFLKKQAALHGKV